MDNEKNVTEATDPRPTVTREEYLKLLESAMQRKKRMLVGSKVFCIGCGSPKKTLFKVGNAYMCKQCKAEYEQAKAAQEAKTDG